MSTQNTNQNTAQTSKSASIAIVQKASLVTAQDVSIVQKVISGILVGIQISSIIFTSFFLKISLVSTAHAAELPFNSGIPVTAEELNALANELSANAPRKEVFIASDRATASGDIDPISFVGIKKSKTAKILDNFKDQQKSILVDKAPFTPDEEVGLFEAEKKIRFLEQMMEKIETDKEELKEQKRVVTTRKFTLQTLIAELDKNIEDKLSVIDTTESNLKDKNREISALLQSIVDLQHKIDVNKEAILSYLAYVYKKGDKIYDDEQQFDIIKTLVFTDGNVSDVLANYHFLTIVEITGQNFLEERRKLLADFYVQSQSLKEQRKNLADLKLQLIEEQQSLEAQREFRKTLLERTMGQESKFNEFISEQQEKQSFVESRLTAIQSIYSEAFESIAKRYGCEMSATGALTPLNPADVQACDNLAVSFEREKDLRKYTLGEIPPNPMEWPAVSTYLSSYFQDPDYYASVGSSHDAIDIPVPQSTEIKAPMPGYVYFVNEPTQNGYGYMAIKHPNGFMTVYGHVSEILVKKYEFVQTGQVFAKSGGLPGTPGAGVMSSGPHLHFEVWHDQKPVDPLRYLDVTKLRFESLTTKYKYKFIEDLKLRYGQRANIEKYNSFVVRGETEIERQKDLLATYAAPSFRDWSVWTEEAVGAKLDPSFLMCIGLAETGLGRSLKTPFNVGNIGNTDSGDTVGFANAREGIYWMGTTLNNKYLGNYSAVSELSRWGNKSGAIYASSPKNWHENIIRCLSALKGRFVEDDYRFRITPMESVESVEKMLQDEEDAYMNDMLPRGLGDMDISSDIQNSREGVTGYGTRTPNIRAVTE